MQKPKLTIVVGAPGSGKTFRLQTLVELGRIDIVIADGLEEDHRWKQTVLKIKENLESRHNVGVCGQSLRERSRRDQIASEFPGQVDFEFFEPAYRACLINVVKDVLKGLSPKLAWSRACCVDAFSEKGIYDIPGDADLLPVFRQNITHVEMDEFFNRVPFEPPGEARLKKLILSEPLASDLPNYAKS